MHKALKGLQYPESQGVRARIRAGEKVSMEAREPWHYVEKDEFFEVPADLLDTMLENGLVEDPDAEDVEDGS